MLEIEGLQADSIVLSRNEYERLIRESERLNCLLRLCAYDDGSSDYYISERELAAISYDATFIRSQKLRNRLFKDVDDALQILTDCVKEKG